MNRCLILGAGLTGLSTAYHLNSDTEYQIFEAENRVGGLCRTEESDGFTFDYTGHFLHFKKEEVKNLVFALMGDMLQAHTRKSGIYLYGVTTPYPFQLNTFGHSVDLIKECLMGLIEAKYDASQGEIKTFEDWILKTCGKGVAKHFMIPYNSKLWTVHPREMTLEWMGSYVPVPDIAGALDGALRPPPETIGYNAQFYYPRVGGIESLPKSFEPHLKNLHFNSRVEWIDLKNRRLGVNGRTEAYDALVSSMPLKSLLSICKNMDPAILEAAGKLRNNSVYTVNIGVNRESLSDYHWLYFPEDKYCFYRAGFPSQLSESMAPRGMSSVNVEISYTDERPVDEKTVLERVVSDLKTANILRDSDQIMTTKIMRIPHAYVIYDKNRKQAMEAIQNYLLEHDVISAGRYGNWEYSAMEDAIYQGMKAAENLNRNSLRPKAASA